MEAPIGGRLTFKWSLARGVTERAAAEAESLADTQIETSERRLTVERGNLVTACRNRRVTMVGSDGEGP